jgi:L-asparaginase II
VVADRALREPELGRQLRRRGRFLAQSDDEPCPEIVGQRAQLLVVADDEDVVRLVVRNREVERMVDRCRLYGISRRFARQYAAAVDAIAVSVRRGGVTEAVHRVHAVAVQGGAVIAEAGDGSLVTLMRSAAKPLQALPAARARGDLDERDLAIASASHLADPAQLEATRALLAKAPAREDELECGPVDQPEQRIRHNCSGKHAAMLALCRAHGWPSEGYRLPGHPVQQAAVREVAAAAEVAADELPTAIDGCGVVTFALPLERMAHAFSRLERLDTGDRVAAAMRARPELIRGPRAADSMLMRFRPGWTAKGGAEGLMCAAGPDGLGVALKVVDGNPRAVAPALARFLGERGHSVPELAVVPLENSRGEVVGELVTDA